MIWMWVMQISGPGELHQLQEIMELCIQWRKIQNEKQQNLRNLTSRMWTRKRIHSISACWAIDQQIQQKAQKLESIKMTEKVKWLKQTPMIWLHRVWMMWVLCSTTWRSRVTAVPWNPIAVQVKMQRDTISSILEEIKTMSSIGIMGTLHSTQGIAQLEITQIMGKI